jgi:phosphohistidine phosphatase
MRVYLAQHGAAVDKEMDPERPLTEKGRADVVRIAALLSAAGVRADRVIHSGKTRAAQSAALLAERLAPGKSPEAVEGLNPKDSGDALVAELAATRGDLLVAGHQPFMGRLASRLLTGRDDAVVLAYQPGSVACLERADDGTWSLQWMLRPDVVPR